MLRGIARKVTPVGLRLAMAQARRAWRDSSLRGPRPRLAAQRHASPGDFPYAAAEVVQEIKGGVFLEGKLANIRLGADLLDGLVVAPGEIFSFWALIGRPSPAAGFQLGRSIRGGVTGGDIGGGLCQVSGIAYEAGLRAGLAIVERHPHSRDLYREDERFTPLGLDATVVWPYKDLRLLNPHPAPVRVGFTMEGLGLVATVHASVALPPVSVEIERTDHDGRRQVRVLRRVGEGAAELVSEDCYEVMPA